MPANSRPAHAWQIAAHNPWLSVSPVSEYLVDPASEPPTIPTISAPRGLHVRQTGHLPCGLPIRRLGRSNSDLRWTGHGPRATRLIAKGATGRIQHDPLSPGEIHRPGRRFDMAYVPVTAG